MNVLSLVEVDDSLGICVVGQITFASRLAATGERISKYGSEPAREGASQSSEDPASALANRFPRAPAANAITA